MRLGARLTSGKLTPFPRSSTTSRTTDSKHLSWAEFSFHREIMRPNPCTGMVKSDRLFRQFVYAVVVEVMLDGASRRSDIVITGCVVDLAECAHVIAKRLGFLSDIQVASRSLLFGLGV
jgi:hypothetical protein